MFKLLVLWIICSRTVVCSQAVKERNLSILLMVSSSARFNTSGAAVAFDLALKRINSEASLLNGYQLNLSTLIDDKCDGPTAVREFLTQIQLPSPTLIGVIGCGCSVSTQPVADIVSSYGLTLISYTPSSSRHFDRDAVNSGGLYELYPSKNNFVRALVAMMRTFKWSQISIITQNEYPFLKIEDMIVQELSTTNLTVLPLSRVRNDQDIDTIFMNGSQINLVNCFEDVAIQIMCAASRSSRRYPDYVWILYGWYSEDWWRSTNDVNCTEDELASVLERALVIQQYPISDNVSNDTTVGYLDQSEVLLRTSSRPFIKTLAYDSLWTLALALNRTMNMINTNDTLDCGPSPVPLEEFSYGNSSTACLIRHTLSKTTFTGMSGPVLFDGSGVRKQDTVRLLQYRNSSSQLRLQQFADVCVDMMSFSYLVEENTSTVWPDGIPPDGSTITVISVFNIAAVVILYAFGIAGIIFSIVCLIFNIVFRKRRIVRLTSPNLNYCIIAGAILTYASVFVRMPFSNSLALWDVCCKLESFLNCIGFTLIFGPILAKMWRIYYIFHNPSPQKKNITDWHLGIFTAIVVSIVLVMLVIGYSIPVTIPRAFTSPDGETRDKRNEQGILQTFLIINCYPPLSQAWSLTLYVYLAILQIAALILAVRIRNVKIKVVNDSKEIAIITYFTTIALVETMLLGLVLQDYNNVSEALSTGHILLAASAVVGLIFIPKMVSLCRDPHGEKVFTNEDTTMSTFTDKTKIAQLEQEIMTLKQRIKD